MPGGKSHCTAHIKGGVLWIGIMGKGECGSSWLPSTALGQGEDTGMGGGASIQGGGTVVLVHTGLRLWEAEGQEP